MDTFLGLTSPPVSHHLLLTVMEIYIVHGNRGSLMSGLTTFHFDFPSDQDTSAAHNVTQSWEYLLDYTTTTRMSETAELF